MQADTHSMGGLVAYTAAAQFILPNMQPWQLVGGAFIAVVGALFPDIDLHTSKAGQKTGIVSDLIEHFCGHRTLFHSPLLYAALYFGLLAIDAAWLPYIQAFTIGVISHLFLDMLNRKGIPLLFPYRKRFHIATIRTGGKIEKIVCRLLGGVWILLLAGMLWSLMRIKG